MKKISINNIVTAIIFLGLYILFDIDVYFVSKKACGWIIFFEIFFIVLSLTPVGSSLFRSIAGSREVLTAYDKDYLMPIFEDVYDAVKEEYPRVSKNIQLYINSSHNINAYALGRDSITLTRGAIDTMSEDELRGVLSHEFGHIVHGDTSLNLFLLIGNIIFMFFYGCFKIIQIATRIVASLLSPDEFKMSRQIIGGIGKVFGSILLFIALALLKINERTNEFQADKYAHQIGYGEELISALYLLKKLDADSNLNMLERLLASHPELDYRISKLEQLEYLN